MHLEALFWNCCPREAPSSKINFRLNSLALIYRNLGFGIVAEDWITDLKETHVEKYVPDSGTIYFLLMPIMKFFFADFHRNNF